MSIKYNHPALDGINWAPGQSRGPRNDASPNAFFSNELQQIRAGLFEQQYPELKGQQLVPPAQGLDPGKVVFTARKFDRAARARLKGSQTTGASNAQVFGTESSITFKSFELDYRFSNDDVRMSVSAGRPLPTMLANATRRGLAEMHDEAILLGNASEIEDLQATGFVGLFTASGTCTYTPSVGQGGSTAFSAKSPDQIVGDLIGAENLIVTTTLETVAPDTLVLPLDTRPQMQSRMGDGESKTIIRHYLDNTDLIKNVIYSAKLNSNSAWTGRRAVMFKKHNDIIEDVTSIMFEQLAPQFIGFDTVTFCEMRTAGSFVYLPKGICYIDGV